MLKMFVDLVGSTALSSQLDPEGLSVIMRRYQNTVSGEINRLEGFVAKFMGDGVLVYFGWPRAHENEAERAVRARLVIVEEVAKLKINSRYWPGHNRLLADHAQNAFVAQTINQRG